MIVTLDHDESDFAAYVGLRRSSEAMRLGRQHRFGGNADRWGNDVEGAAAELAVAKALDHYWQPLAADPASLPGDVGRLQVRQTKRADGCLILHESDPDDAPFILVTGAVPTFTLAGWLWGREGKRPEHWRTSTGRPAFFVPQSALRAVPDRRAELREAA